MMKTIILILIIISLGFFFKENSYTLNLCDTYYIVSYLTIAFYIALILLLVKLAKFILKR